MNQKLLFVLSIIIVTFGYISYESYTLEKKFSSFNTAQSNTIIKTLPAISMDVFDTSEKVDLATLAGEGNSLVIHFWATWCAPCEKEFPELVELTKLLKNKKDVKFLFVAVNDKAKDIKKFLKRFKGSNNYTVLVDETNIHQKSFGTFRLPETFIFDKNSNIIKKFIGQQAWTQKHFVDLLYAL